MLRNIQYRSQIRAMLRAACGPMSAAEVHALLGTTGIGIATVYRILSEGLEDGDLTCVELPGGPRRFEPADRPRHQYFECVECEKVYSIFSSLDNLESLLPTGFELKHHEVILSGRCPDCAQAEAMVG